LKIGIPKETFDRECRVAATPESVTRLLKAHFQQVLLEEHAGTLSKFNNDAYAAAGAQIVPNVWKDADIILKVR
jgi:alanine dehydrogenase